MQNNKSLKVSSFVGEKVYVYLKSVGFNDVVDPNPYLKWKLKGPDLTVLFYTSGSMVAQGLGDFEVIVGDILEGNVSKKNTQGKTDGKDSDISETEYVSHLGNDEVGKGDYFGPLVVCSVYLQKQDLNQVSALGVTDSKKLSDVKCIEVFNALKDTVKYSVHIAHPSEYNVEVKRYVNLAYYLAFLHAKATAQLVEEVVEKDLVCIVDQFSSNKGRLVNAFKGIPVKLVQFHKGESDPAVALASVFARAIFVSEMEEMGKRYGVVFPKGATDVINFAKAFVAKNGKDELGNVAKISFKTTLSVL